MGNVNEGHERDEGLSSASDSADDLSASSSVPSYDERDDGWRSQVDLLDESGDPSVLSDSINANSSLDAILAESTRVEQTVELNRCQHLEVSVDTTTMVNEPGMISLTSNLSLPISESIIPCGFDLLGEESPFAEGEELFHTPDLSAESKGETSEAHTKQMRTSFSDDVSNLFTLVGDSSSPEDIIEPLGTEDNDLLGKHDSLPSDEDGLNELQTFATLRDAADEMTAKFGSADFVLTSTTVSDSPLSIRITECDKCGHVLSDGDQSKTQLDRSEQRPINDKRGEQAYKEEAFLATEEGMVNKDVDLVTNDIIAKEEQVDEAGTNERSFGFQVSSFDARGKTCHFILKRHIPLVASSSDSVANSEELTQEVESRGKDLEWQPLSPLANLAPHEGSTNDQELLAPCQDLDIHPSVTTKVPDLSPLPLVSHGINACMEDSTAILSSPVSRAICSIIAVESIADKGFEVPPEKTEASIPSFVVPEVLANEKNGPDVEATIMPDVPTLSSGVTVATLTKSTTVNESTAKEESCIPATNDEKHVSAPQPPRHTPDRPNWAVAPAEPASVSNAPAKTQRRKPSSRRGRKSGETAPKDGPPTSSTSSATRSPITPSAVTLQLPPKCSDVKALPLKSSGTKTPEAKSPEVKAPVAEPTDTKVPDAKKAPKPILRLPDISTYQRPETKPIKVKPAVSFEAVPSRTAKTTTEGLSAPTQQTISSTKMDSVSNSRGEVVATALPPASQTSVFSKSTSSVEPAPARRGRSVSISSVQNSALPPNKRPASIVSSWRSGMALPVIPEGTTKIRQSDDGRKSIPAVLPSVATVNVSAKDKMAAILAESCQSNNFKFDASKAQGNNGATASTLLRPASVTVPKDDIAFKQRKTQPPESPLAEGFQTNEHSLLAWRHGVIQRSPPVVVHNSSGGIVTIRKAEDKDPQKDVAVSNSKAKTKAVKAKSKAKASQPSQERATVNSGHHDLSSHVQECGEPVKVNLPQTATLQEPLRYHTPPRIARPAFFSDVNVAAPVTPSPVSAPAHQHNIALQRLGAVFSAHSSKAEYSVNADMHPQKFMPQRSEGISSQHSVRVEQPPQLRHYKFVPRNHTASRPAGYPTSSIPIRGIDATIDHLGPHPVQVPHTSRQALATYPSFVGQTDNQFFDGMDDFNGCAQPRDFSSYQQQLYQQRQAETTKQSQRLRHRPLESSFAQSRVSVPIPESWNGSLTSRPVDQQDINVPIYQTSRPSAPPTNFAARAHGPPFAGQRMGPTFNNSVNQFPPYN